MKLLKLALISVVVLFLLLTAIASLLPSNVRISRAVNISAQPAVIMEKIQRLDEWQQWNEYVKALPGATVARDSIISENLGIHLIKQEPNYIHTQWLQKNGKAFEGVFNLLPREPVTVVQWYFNFSFKWYPWEKFSSIVYDKQLGPHMEQSLNNLKQLIEKAP